MTNYICINGKKAELTEEQMKALGIELPKVNSPFKRVESEMYYHIATTGEVLREVDTCHFIDEKHFDVGNYCTDKIIMEQRALHEILNRLLWRYSMEHDGDKINWNCRNTKKYFIYYNHASGNYGIDSKYDYNFVADVYFYRYEIAENAIKEIVVPFMKAHEFKW